MSLKKEDIEKIAHLSRLAIQEGEIESYSNELSNILGLVAQMESINTEGVAPMAHPLDVAQRLRPDEVSELDNRDNFQSIAPAVENGLYLVPKVIE